MVQYESKTPPSPLKKNVFTYVQLYTIFNALYKEFAPIYFYNHFI